MKTKTPKTFSVYKHTTPNGKVYIGITSQRPESRWGKAGSGYKSAGQFRYAINKYGWENISHVILATGVSEEDAYAAEKKLIKRYRSNDFRFGYNSTAGGDTAAKLSEEAREKIRLSKLGCKNPMWGKHLSAEHRQRISSANSGRKLSEITIAKQRLAQSNRSPETLRRLHDAQAKRPVRCVETGVCYDSLSAAARAVSASSSNIAAVLHGRRKTTKGFHWEYIEAS